MPGPSALDEYSRKRNLRLVGGSESDRPPSPPGAGDPGDPAADCPLTVLGRADGVFYFLDIEGELRKLSGRQLGTRSELVALFLGDTSWLMRHFAKTAIRKFAQSGQTIEEEVVIGFLTASAGEFLMAMARQAGIYGPHVVLRGAGIWTDEDGAPVVHCGNAVFAGDVWRPAGRRDGNQVWTLTAATQRPEGVAGTSIGQGLQASVRELWSFAQPGGDMLALGLIGTGYYGAAASWRPNGFLTGLAGSGKSMLLDLMRAAVPLHHYTNDTSGAGIEQACNGHAMPIFIDEAADRQRGATALLDVLLAATGGAGTRGHRGSVSGQVRTIELVGSVVLASVDTPPMQPQHLSRITVIELKKAGAGADNRAAMMAAIARTREAASALWGRALHGFDRWRAALDIFRDCLGSSGCAAREMDQFGALLAGWWVLTHDGVPEMEAGFAAVAQIIDFVRVAYEVEQDDAPHRMIQHLMSSTVQMDRSSEIEQVGVLLDLANKHGAEDTGNRNRALDVLGRVGIRVVNRSTDWPGNPAPRAGQGDGVWIAVGNISTLEGIFRNSDFGEGKWKGMLARFEKARKLNKNMRIGGYTGRVIWLPMEDVRPPET